MKKVLILIFLALAINSSISYKTFPKKKVVDFLGGIDEMIQRGDGDGACDALASSMTFDMVVPSAGQKIRGNREDLCQFYKAMAQFSRGGPAVETTYSELSVYPMPHMWQQVLVKFKETQSVANMQAVQKGTAILQKRNGRYQLVKLEVEN